MNAMQNKNRNQIYFEKERAIIIIKKVLDLRFKIIKKSNAAHNKYF